MNISSLLALFIFPILILPGCTSSYKMSSDHTPAPPTTSLETDLLLARPGYSGETLGAEVIDSSIGPAGEQQVIKIEVPIEPDLVDKVQVISESGETIKQRKAAEIIRNYENNNVGVTIFLSKDKNWEFKLRLIDSDEGDQ